MKIMKNFNLNWNYMKENKFEEAFRILKTRFERNNLDINLLKDKIVLDLGCGSGRYTYALKKLGAKEVTGVDLDISFAEENIKVEGIKFMRGSVDKIPQESDSFDFVFCNGVLHHTDNLIKEGIKEISRVLKKEGHSWIYVYGSGSKFWGYCDDIRDRLKGFPIEEFDRILNFYFPDGRGKILLDIFYSPRIYYSREEYKEIFKENNLEVIKIIERGADHDFPELIYKNPELKDYYGDGELKFIVKK